MRQVVVLGGGMVGSVLAADLAEEQGFAVTIFDLSEDSLERAGQRCGGRVSLEKADLSDPGAVSAAIDGAELVVGALASHLGYQALEIVMRAGKRYCDISFMPENALALDALAKEHGGTAVVDCGVAPGLSHMMAGCGVARLERAERIEIYVGGLPRERHWPYEYKAGFAPHDVIEEYTRESRLVVGGQVVTREALSEPELLDFPGVGTLEAFNTDGLRSLVETLDVPNMKEKTLRYPGHIELMRTFRESGFFSKEPVEVGGVSVRPLDVFSKLVFPAWEYKPGEEDLTVMRVLVDGVAGGAHKRYCWDLLDYFERASGATSMARTTAFPCAIVARLLAEGRIPGPGVFAPEAIGANEELFGAVVDGLDERNIVITES